MSEFRVGMRIRCKGDLGTITEIDEERSTVRLKLDDEGQERWADLKALLAVHEAAPVVKDKAVRGPREKAG